VAIRVDHRPVGPNSAAKTISTESAFPQGREDIRRRVRNQAIRPGALLESVGENAGGGKKTGKMRFFLLNKGEKLVVPDYLISKYLKSYFIF
jgi:hypothetical protein